MANRSDTWGIRRVGKGAVTADGTIRVQPQGTRSRRLSSPLTAVRGVKYVSLHEPSGYGIAARRAILALHRAAVPVTWEPLVRGRGWGLSYEPLDRDRTGDAELDPLCRRSLPVSVVVAHTVPEYFPQIAAANPGIPFVGSTVWETTRVPSHWPPLLATAKRLIVPCKWNGEVFRASGVGPPVDVVPHHLDDRPLAARSSAPLPPLCDAQGRPTEIGANDFVFYTLGEWNARKAIDRTIEAFLLAFRAGEPVVLVVKTSPHDMSAILPPRLTSSRRAVSALMRRHRTAPRVLLSTAPASDAMIRGLHARGDCYVSLCRSEGWGLGIYDAAAAGRPVVVTGYGGQLDYLPPDYPYLVRHEVIPVRDARGGRSYAPGQCWAEPDVQHGADLLRAVFDSRDAAATMGADLSRHVHARFADDVLTARLLSALERAAA